MYFLERIPKIKDIWNKLNKKQKRLLLALALSTSALGCMGCGDKDINNNYNNESNIDTDKLEDIAKKYGLDLIESYDIDEIVPRKVYVLKN